MDSDDYIEKIFTNINKMDSAVLNFMIFGFYRRVGATCSKNQPLVRENQNADLKQMTTLDKKNRIKRFLVKH